MAKYLVRRVIGALVAVLGVSVLAFCTAALVPGSPASVLLGSNATSAQVAVLNRALGLTRPLPVRYLYWIKNILEGNLGNSVLSGQSVSSLLGSALIVTGELSALAVLGGLLVALPVGLLLGYKSDSRAAKPVMTGLTVGVSVPGFWTGLMLIELFAVKLRWFPTSGYTPFTTNPIGNLRSMVLPVITLGIWIAVPLIKFLRSTTVEILRQDYVTTAQAKGMSSRRLLVRHVAPNAITPTLTYFGLQLGFLISGAIIVEYVFALPGMGRLGLNAILSRDYPTVQAVVLVVAVGYVIVNLLIDLLYAWIDPRVRLT